MAGAGDGEEVGMRSMMDQARLAGAASRRSFLDGRGAGLRRTGPELVIEGYTVPRVPIDTTLGAVLGISGAALLAEALVAVFASEEQGTWPTIFRLFRMALGGGLVVWTVASTK
jgi:hypothetical protein